MEVAKSEKESDGNSHSTKINFSFGIFKIKDNFTSLYQQLFAGIFWYLLLQFLFMFAVFRLLFGVFKIHYKWVL